jgi:hypothetical protein
MSAHPAVCRPADLLQTETTRHATKFIRNGIELRGEPEQRWRNAQLPVTPLVTSASGIWRWKNRSPNPSVAAINIGWPRICSNSPQTPTTP